MNPIPDRFAAIIRHTTQTLKLIPDQQQVLITEILFTDDTRLIAREYTYFDTGRTKYSYQWMGLTNELIHRWDNAHESHSANVPDHHQHVGSEENIQPSEPMTLERVLAHIATQYSA